MKKFTFNFSFLERFRKSKHSESTENEIDNTKENATQNSEYDSDESPEEFAEKTLSGLNNIDKYQQELQENSAENASSEESSEIDDEEVEGDEGDEDNNDVNDDETNEQFKEMKFPKPPEAAPKFKFKFPMFDRLAASNKIKATLKGKSPLGIGLGTGLDKLNWNDLVLRLFSPYTRGKIHALFVIFLVVVVAYMLGKNVALVINMAPPVAKTARPPISLPLEKPDTTIQDINKITSINLFNAKENDKSSGTEALKKDIESIVCLDAEKATTLQIKLLDTIVLQDSVKSVASVQVRGSSELMNVREGERLDEMVEISKINRMKLILKNLQTGDCEYAATESEAETPMPYLKIISAKAAKSLFKSKNPNIKNTGNQFKIKRAFRDSMITNMSDILTQAKAVQIINPDGSLCYKMTEVMPGSLYSQLDIQENDIICSINGKKIENLNELMGLLGRIKEIDQFQIGLKRNGMPENKEYGFE